MYNAEGIEIEIKVERTDMNDADAERRKMACTQQKMFSGDYSKREGYGLYQNVVEEKKSGMI